MFPWHFSAGAQPLPSTATDRRTAGSGPASGALQPGDLVRVTRTGWRHRSYRGATGIVVDTLRTRNEVVLRLDDGRRRRLPASRVSRAYR
ncbi:MAG: hypothetical protein R2749_08905 [Acidimicrobiales bacterium]